jgi:hypothetical protein
MKHTELALVARPVAPMSGAVCVKFRRQIHPLPGVRDIVELT